MYEGFNIKCISLNPDLLQAVAYYYYVQVLMWLIFMYDDP